jgi:hypothetical protein
MAISPLNLDLGYIFKGLTRWITAKTTESGVSQSEGAKCTPTWANSRMHAFTSI